MVQTPPDPALAPVLEPMDFPRRSVSVLAGNPRRRAASHRPSPWPDSCSSPPLPARRSSPVGAASAALRSVRNRVSSARSSLVSRPSCLHRSLELPSRYRQPLVENEQFDGLQRTLALGCRVQPWAQAHADGF
ncbi:hypothetical protein ZWY2020_033851 [Hordeum vulgare]|nr:hypothetical protein ZWY2020_033851 [Hordeum vulgare]